MLILEKYSNSYPCCTVSTKVLQYSLQFMIQAKAPYEIFPSEGRNSINFIKDDKKRYLEIEIGEDSISTLYIRERYNYKNSVERKFPISYLPFIIKLFNNIGI